ncbi:MAG TPA: hypothetical protein VJ934_07765 [Desulfomicrobiaceae bacterium]|nr:hypothetical protein [Desulfomicrobiaceae bacterium]
MNNAPTLAFALFTAGHTAAYRQDNGGKVYLLPPVPQRGAHDDDSNK